ncbi:Cloroperoxidase [Sistotremastrum suecicum HHB10207 ss-3]|uniref:Cloroperoxidase n=1 Tax=Sistotremastrum suecicum HHB10207 ss-3 TaxID=1314776 RepID=A0A165YV36_9AGAM|nr:Cloroperoxidase [Sistotremastrum suecicum HHB10207 ss-3]
MTLSRALKLSTALLCFSGAVAFPSASAPPGSAQKGVLIVVPPVSNDTGIKMVPDNAHPFQAPGPNDQRGPCPGLNTLANHGYLPRNGIASFEQIITAVREGFNMEHDLAGALAGFAMLARGNAFLDLVSIGGVSPLIPVLPGAIDGPKPPGGIATHGRFEGDVSMTRQDAAIGDNVHFQDSLYDELLLYVGKFGDNSPVTGNSSIVTTKVMQEFKFARFVEDQIKNPVLQYHAGRNSLSYGEAAFVLNFFANGTDGTLSTPVMGSFFRNQTFPDDWYRRSSPGNITLIGQGVDEIRNAHPVPPGANAPNGTYVLDAPINSCSDVYFNLAVENLPASYSKATGVFKQNVDTLLAAVAKAFGCPVIFPTGPSGV